MLMRDGHCAQCGLHFDKTKLRDFRMGSACPDPACPSHNRDRWHEWFDQNEGLSFDFGPIDWFRLRKWVAPFKLAVRQELDLPEVDQDLLR